MVSAACGAHLRCLSCSESQVLPQPLSHYLFTRAPARTPTRPTVRLPPPRPPKTIHPPHTAYRNYPRRLPAPHSLTVPIHLLTHLVGTHSHWIPFYRGYLFVHLTPCLVPPRFVRRPDTHLRTHALRMHRTPPSPPSQLPASPTHTSSNTHRHAPHPRTIGICSVRFLYTTPSARFWFALQGTYLHLDSLILFFVSLEQ